MFKFLKNKQNIQSILVGALFVGSITYLVYLIFETEQFEEQFEEFETQLTELETQMTEAETQLTELEEYKK